MTNFFKTILIILLFFCPYASAQFTSDIMYQGFIIENSVPYTGLKNLTFKIFPSLTGTEPVWTCTMNNVNIIDGVYNCRLSAGTPDFSTLDWKGDRFIEVFKTVSGVSTPLGTRTKFSAVPYAVNARNVQNKGYITVSTNPGNGDYNSISEAISALPASGGTILLMNGEYSLTAELSLLKNIELTGINRDNVQLINYKVKGTELKNITLRNLSIVQGEFLNCTNVVLENIACSGSLNLTGKNIKVLSSSAGSAQITGKQLDVMNSEINTVTVNCTNGILDNISCSGSFTLTGKKISVINSSGTPIVMNCADSALDNIVCIGTATITGKKIDVMNSDIGSVIMNSTNGTFENNILSGSLQLSGKKNKVVNCDLNTLISGSYQTVIRDNTFQGTISLASCKNVNASGNISFASAGSELTYTSITNLNDIGNSWNYSDVGLIGTYPALKDGWLLCDGRTIHPTSTSANLYGEKYQRLYDYLKGTGNTNFYKSSTGFVKLPDLRGIFVRSIDNRAYASGGKDPDGIRIAGSFQTNNLKMHNHIAESYYHYHTGTTGNGPGCSAENDCPSGGGGDSTVRYVRGQEYHSHSFTTSGDTHTHTIQNTGGVETRPINIALFYLIKY